MKPPKKRNLAHKCLKNISSITKFEKRGENGDKRKPKVVINILHCRKLNPYKIWYVLTKSTI